MVAPAHDALKALTAEQAAQKNIQRFHAATFSLTAEQAAQKPVSSPIRSHAARAGWEVDRRSQKHCRLSSLGFSRQQRPNARHVPGQIIWLALCGHPASNKGASSSHLAPRRSQLPTINDEITKTDVRAVFSQRTNGLNHACHLERLSPPPCRLLSLNRLRPTTHHRLRPLEFHAPID